MTKIEVSHGGEIFDKNYPNGIPTNVQLIKDDNVYESGLIMFPAGHANNKDSDLLDILDNKF